MDQSMDISGSTKLFGIFGFPIKHTLSPKLHNAVFEKRKMDAVYLPFEVKPDDLFNAVGSIKSLGICGLNITLPHKEMMLEFIDEIPQDVDRAVGAINTLYLDGGTLKGFNTDGPGFLKDLKAQLDFDPEGRRVLMVGAGGAGRAVAFYLLQAQCEELIIYNRTHERAQGLAKYLSDYYPEKTITTISSIEDLKINQIDLLVNASACGMKSGDPLPLNPEILNTTKAVYDLIYAPKETTLLKEAKKRKLPHSNGVGMLIYQACLSQSLWFSGSDESETFEIMREAYDEWLTQ